MEPYTMSEWEEVLWTFKTYDELYVHLKDLLEEIAGDLSFDSAINIDVTKDEVRFTAEWTGSYQSHDTESFSFPAHLLLQGQAQITAYLKAEIKNKKEAKEREQKEEAEQKERREYERLKQKYGDQE